MTFVRNVLVVSLIAAVLACGGRDDDAPPRARKPPRAAAASPSPPPPPPSPSPTSTASDLPTDWRLPDGWVWVTISEDGYAIGMPRLPRAQRNRDGTMHVIIAETAPAVVTVVRRSDAFDAVHQIRSNAARAGGRITLDEPFRGSGRRIDLDTATGSEVNALLEMPDGATILVDANVPRGQEFDSGALLESLTFDELRVPRRIRHAEGHMVVEAPSRMDPIEERRAPPPVLGFHGVLDGNQMSVLFVPIGPGAADADALATQQTTKCAAIAGTIVSSEARTVDGRLERWFRCRSSQGTTLGAVRMFFARGNLYTAAVFAPNGTEPPWAARFLASLAVDPVP